MVCSLARRSTTAGDAIAGFLVEDAVLHPEDRLLVLVAGHHVAGLDRRLVDRRPVTLDTTAVSGVEGLRSPPAKPRVMYSARDQVENEAWLDDLEGVAERLGYGESARSRAVDLFLSNLPDDERADSPYPGRSATPSRSSSHASFSTWSRAL